MQFFLEKEIKPRDDVAFRSHSDESKWWLQLFRSTWNSVEYGNLCWEKALDWLKHVAGNVQGLGLFPALPQPFFVALGKLFNWFCNSTVRQEWKRECRCFFTSSYLSA